MQGQLFRSAAALVAALKAAALPPHSEGGYGLNALRERLETVYGASLNVRHDDAGFEVSFSIPCGTGSQPVRGRAAGALWAADGLRTRPTYGVDDE